ncbi:MAG: hypothetical protein JWM76_5240 [Pseudonocardiales bacterium]|nr:hypothetical protein [Pseudonocardiales bacterium]
MPTGRVPTVLGFPHHLEPQVPVTSTTKAGSTAMILIILLVILAAVTGVLGAIIKGAFWLFIFTVLFLVAAFFMGKRSRT